ncbi:hypothetical protein [Tenacibaculum agarivorans]|uniref:hypothetical protein n=1 Tax=Tenacibaculum agarivorans TaxID=1908389 RepID=UPI00094B9848|nr:hypothetical protein [Tenacibaculum agarivorans]
MARTIAEIQKEIIQRKNSIAELNQLDNTSKTSIWKLWAYVTATAIWSHERIVERNTLVSRPHTLNWYREQALNFVYGHPLIWEEGFFKFDSMGLSEAELIAKKVVKHCAVGEVDLETILSEELPKTQDDVNNTIAQYFHNQVGVIFMKVAGENGAGNIEKLSKDELTIFREYTRQIKDAGNQIQIISVDGDQLHLKIDAYIDPLKIYVNPSDVEHYTNPDPALDHQFDTNNGVLIADSGVRPIELAIQNFLKGLEFNGGLVRTFLTDAIQQAEGVKIPIIREIKTAAASLDVEIVPNEREYFIPQSGYFDIEKLNIEIKYIPYTFYRNYI